MSKTNKQKEAEDALDEIFSLNDTGDLNYVQYKMIKKICLEMYNTGYEHATLRAEDMITDVVCKLNK